MMSNEQNLRVALEAILKANDEFRAGMPDGWEGDPLQDACNDARALLAHTRPDDHWGWIRGADDELACIARRHDLKDDDKHRIDKTDPYAANAAFIVKAVNNHDALVDFMRWVDSWVSHPVGSYSVAALDGLFGMTRDKIAALNRPVGGKS
jgi:hypothetical protein